MSITVYPYKLTQRELEARLEPGLTVLPGQYLRFATAEPIFGQVREVRALPPSSPGLLGGYRLLIDLLYGTPSLNPQQVVLLNAAQMGHEIQRLQEPIAQPLRLSPDFNAELWRLGALTVIGGDDFVQKYEALQLLIRAIQPHRRLIILDPLGVFAEEDGFALWEAGRDVRLSLQAIGSKSFLDTFGELFAPGLREAALRIVADHLPPMHEFLGFHSLLDWYGSLSVPLKNLILQNFEHVARSFVFADAPEQALNWARTAQSPATVLNLSALPEPWRGLFFREAVQSLLAQSGEDVVPVLLYPENYLPNLSHWVQKADEAEFKLIMLASPYADKTLLGMANNRLWVESQEEVSLIGSLTMGLPLRLPALNTLAATGPRAAEASFGAVSRDVRPAQETERHQGSFSSFNVPLVDLPGGESGALGDFQASELEPPIHWLGEAAGPLESQAIADDGKVTPLAEGDSQPEPDSWAPTAAEIASHSFPEPRESEELSVTEAAAASGLGMSSVVDLSSPQAVATPEFLTASQLSDLLASGASRMEAQADFGHAQPEADFSDDDQLEESVHSAFGLADFNSSTATQEPAFSAANELPLVNVEEPSAALLSADHFPPPEEEVHESAALAEEPRFEVEAAQPALPPFPTPEEYERDEFHFDLNPDPSAYQPAAPAEHGETHREADFVAQSLDEFASLDRPNEPRQPASSGMHAEEEPFHFVADFDSSENATARPVGSREGSEIAADIAATDQELSDTLDLIFPNYPHAGQTEEAESEDEREPEAVIAPKPVRDEPMAIVQKPIEPPRGESKAFHAGDRVKHPSYGQGVVQKVIPTEESVVLNIAFDTVGKRLLDPALCELTREAVH